MNVTYLYNYTKLIYMFVCMYMNHFLLLPLFFTIDYNSCNCVLYNKIQV